MTAAPSSYLLCQDAEVSCRFAEERRCCKGRLDCRDRGESRRVAGVLIAVAGLLLIIAAYWGQLFS
jgi:hypothetical protein